MKLLKLQTAFFSLVWLLVLTEASDPSLKICKVGQQECECKTDDETGKTKVSCVQLELKKFPSITTLPDTTNELDLSLNEIASLDLIEYLPNLEVLNLANNQISNLTSNTFEKYGTLKVLDFSHNSLYKPKEFFFDGLENLKVLNLSYNTFRKLPDNIFAKLNRLQELVLRGNPMHMIRYELLQELETLVKLDLSAAAIDHLEPGVFHTLFKLEHLDLSQNNFEEVPSKGLQSATGLKHLCLGRNRISTIKGGAFGKLSKLETLDLSDMAELTTIESGAFSGLTSLLSLTIKSNPNLRTISMAAFQGLYSSTSDTWTLQELYLRQNGLQRIESPSLALCKIRVLDLQENPWDCDCRMQWTDQCLIKPELQSAFTCTTPENLNGKLIREITSEEFVCVDEALLKHQERILRIIVIGSAITGVFFCGLVIIVILKKRSIMEWWYYRKRGSGAVYYVKAQSNSKETGDNGDC